MEIRDFIRGFLGFPPLGDPREVFQDDHTEYDNPQTSENIFDPLGLHRIFEAEMRRMAQGIFGSESHYVPFLEEEPSHESSSVGSRDFMLNKSKGGPKMDSETQLSEIPRDEMEQFFEKAQGPHFSLDRSPEGSGFFGSSVVEERTVNADGSMRIVRTERSSDGRETKTVTTLDPSQAQIQNPHRRAEVFPFSGPGFSNHESFFKRLFF